MEGSNGLAYNLSNQPEDRIIYGFFARLMFMPSYYLSTFEEAFYTGFFTFPTKIFSPEVTNLRARFVAYQAMEKQSQMYAMVTSRTELQQAEEYKKGMQLLAQRRTLKRVQVGTT